MTESKSNTDARLCECGCGTTVAKRRRFLRYHINRVMIREKHPFWKDGIRRTGGYVAVISPDHPHRDKAGYVRRSRLLVELHLGRYLGSDEHVHHVNRITDDDRIENLQVMSRASHIGLHHSKLKQSEIDEIRRLQKEGKILRVTGRPRAGAAPIDNLTTLSKRYGVHKRTIARILDVQI